MQGNSVEKILYWQSVGLEAGSSPRNGPKRAAGDGICPCRRLPKPNAKPGSIQADRHPDMPVRLMDDGRLSGGARTFEVVAWHAVF